jgi:hypothetical protein
MELDINQKVKKKKKKKKRERRAREKNTIKTSFFIKTPTLSLYNNNITNHQVAKVRRKKRVIL